MKKNMTKSKCSLGFTILELITVIAIITLIISIIIPALNMAKRYARELRQTAQMHSIESALGMFYNDNDDYPPSNLTETGGVKTCGAQKLAEAVVGCDLQGYDPVSNFDLAANENNPRAYAITDPEKSRSLKRRKGPYLVVTEDTGAYDLKDLFGAGSTGSLYPGGDHAAKKFGPILCDTYKNKQITVGSKKVIAGTPVLYYCASRASKKFDKTQRDGNIYNYSDNADLIALGPLVPKKVPPEQHPFSDMQVFYDAITNPAIKVEERSYNPETYILISAGADGLYGTKDDISNFGR